MLNKNLIISFLLIFSSALTYASTEGDVAAGQTLSFICVDCHGMEGRGDEDIPALAGKSAAYIKLALMSFKSGIRIDEGEDMSEIASELSDKEIADLAAYYATLTVQ